MYRPQSVLTCPGRSLWSSSLVQLDHAWANKSFFSFSSSTMRKLEFFNAKFSFPRKREKGWKEERVEKGTIGSGRKGKRKERIYRHTETQKHRNRYVQQSIDVIPHLSKVGHRSALPMDSTCRTSSAYSLPCFCPECLDLERLN